MYETISEAEAQEAIDLLIMDIEQKWVNEEQLPNAFSLIIQVRTLYRGCGLKDAKTIVDCMVSQQNQNLRDMGYNITDGRILVAPRSER